MRQLTEPRDRAFTETSQRLNTQTIAKLQTYYAQTATQQQPTGRNAGVLKSQTGMTGFSSFSKSRSPMKSRQFTKPAQKPTEDEIVKSMDIITLDMVP